MSRIIGVTLLLIILADNFFDSTASHARFPEFKVRTHKCTCRVFPNGKIKCHFPLRPTKHVEKQGLLKCVCSRTGQHKFEAACPTWRTGIPISLV